MTTNAEQAKLLTPEELCEFLGGIPVATVYKWRYSGTGPRSIKVGRHIRYRMSDVERWLEQHATPAAS